MDPLDDILITGMLRTDSSGKVLQSEDDKIEYKEIFDNSSKEAKAKYAKELAALYNYQGGYMVFGVNDKTLELVGLSNFSVPDNADLVNDLSTYFSPAIRFRSRLLSVNGTQVFVIYVERRNSIPTVCIKSYPAILGDGTIYWRYSAQSSPIRPGDLIDLLKTLQGEDNRKAGEIAQKQYRSQFRPRLFINGETKSGSAVIIRIENRGEIAHVDEFEVIEKNVDQLYAPRWRNYPIEKDRGAKIEINGGQTHWQQLQFKLAMNYHDDEGHKYQAIIEFNNGAAKISETIEL